MTGELEAGARLPSEPELVLHYEVSRSTWREALRTLAAEKLVVATRGVTGGTFVMEPSMDDVESYLSNSVTMLMRNQLSLEQILEARSFLEVPAAGLAAQRRTDEQIAVLATSIESISHGNRSQLWAANTLFHTTILEATGNPLLRALISPISGALRTKVLRDGSRPTFMEQAGRDHANVLEAVRDGDVSGAEEAMREHLARLGIDYLELQATEASGRTESQLEAPPPGSRRAWVGNRAVQR